MTSYTTAPFRLASHHKLQILAFPHKHYEAFVRSLPLPRRLGAVELCNHEWTDALDFQSVLTAISKELVRLFLVQASRHFPMDVWNRMHDQALGMNHDIFHSSVTWDQLICLRDLVLQFDEGAKKQVPAPAPARFPIPEEVRLRIIVMDEESRYQENLKELAEYASTHGLTPKSNICIGGAWCIGFDSQKNLDAFIERVERLERIRFDVVIPDGIQEYPLSLWTAFFVRVCDHFGKANITHASWRRTAPIDVLRKLAHLLTIHDLDKVEDFLKKDNQPDPAPTTTTTGTAVSEQPSLEVREARFLAKLVERPTWAIPMVHYMGVSSTENCVRTIAEVVRVNTDAARFEDWEAVLEKRDPNHILCKVMAVGTLTVEQRSALDGLIKMETVGQVEKGDPSNVWRKGVLFHWKELSDRQKALVHAFLDQMPVNPPAKEEKEEEKK